MKEWIIQNWKLVIMIALGLVLIITLAFRKKKRPALCELDIHEQRKRLREMDEFLSDMQDYFKQVDKFRK